MRLSVVYETPIPYEGLGFAHLTVKAHYQSEDNVFVEPLRQVSMEIPVCLMTDESAIFVKNEGVTQIGQIYWMDKGEIRPITQEELWTKIPTH